MSNHIVLEAVFSADLMKGASFTDRRKNHKDTAKDFGARWQLSCWKENLIFVDVVDDKVSKKVQQNRFEGLP